MLDENKTIIGLKFILLLLFYPQKQDENKTIIGLKSYLTEEDLLKVLADENKTIIGLKFVMWVNSCMGVRWK